MWPWLDTQMVCFCSQCLVKEKLFFTFVVQVIRLFLPLNGFKALLNVFAQDEKQAREMSPPRVGTLQDTLQEYWRADHDEISDEWMLAVVYLRQEGSGHGDPTKTVTFYRKRPNTFASLAWEKHNKKLPLRYIVLFSASLLSHS